MENQTGENMAAQSRDNLTESRPRSNNCNPCSWWTTFCHYLLRKQNEFWGVVGSFIGKRPVLVIIVCLLVCGALSGGFALMEVETRTEKLFIPQDSRSIKDLNKANEHFTLSTREIDILLQPTSGDDILNALCLQDALQIHNMVKSINGFDSLCVKSAKPNDSFPCLVLTPLELFDYNQSNFNNITTRLTALLDDPTYIMSNSRQTSKNFPVLFGNLEKNVTTGAIETAKVIRMIYYLHEKEADKVLEWEMKFSKKIIELKETLKHVEVFFYTENSLDEAIKESTSGDIVLISGTFTIMITFACFMLAKFRNPLTGHSNLAMAGVMCVGLGILSAFGLSMYIGIPFISLVGVLPFLVLGIGMDDMFIIVDELDRTEPDEVPERIRKTMSHIGASITMTTVTDLVAFAVSTMSSFPAIRHFCVYAALSITFVFLFQVTLFLCFVSFDLKRIAKGYRDMPVCMKAPPPAAGSDSWDRPLPQTSNKVIKVWAKFLMLWPVRITVFVISLGLLAGGIYGTLHITEEFDRKMLAKDGSDFILYLNKFEETFPQTIEVNIILDGDINYTDTKVQTEILKLDEIARNNDYYQNKSVSWMRSFKDFAVKYNLTTTGSAFFHSLNIFLSQKGYSSFKTDIVFNKNHSKIEASRLLVYYISTSSSITQRDAMLSLRKDLEDDSTLPAYAISRPFIFFEQYAITKEETIRNLIIASLTILIITAPTLTNPLVILLVFYGFVSLIFELLGLMYIWNVSLNSISMINLVMAIGFAVDYSAHVAHSFVVSTEQTTEERIVEALSTVGASVLMGGLSTFFGMLLTAFAASEVFRIFFRMFFGIVVMGLVHGLCFLPVLLSLFYCRTSRVNVNEKKESNVCIKNYWSGSGLDVDHIPNGLSHEVKPDTCIGTEKIPLDDNIIEVHSDDKLPEKQPLEESHTDDENSTAQQKTAGDPSRDFVLKPVNESSAIPEVEPVQPGNRSVGGDNTQF